MKVDTNENKVGPLSGDEYLIGTLNNPSALGANPDLPGFTVSNLNNHWVGGKSDHSKDYSGYTKDQYAKRAHDLVRSKAEGNILGYKAANDAVVRYDKDANDFVKGMPSGIKSMFKPKRGVPYFNDQLARDGASLQEMEGYKVIKCPVCGQYEFEEENNFEGCDVCHWQNDGVQMDSPNYWGGANDLCLNDYRSEWQSLFRISA